MRRLGVLLVPATTLVTALVPALVLAPPGTATSAAGQAGAGPKHQPFDDWTEQVVDADQNFRGLAAVSRTEAWVTGESLSDGAARVYHTTDGGETWADVSPVGTEGLS